MGSVPKQWLDFLSIPTKGGRSRTYGLKITWTVRRSLSRRYLPADPVGLGWNQQRRSLVYLSSGCYRQSWRYTPPVHAQSVVAAGDGLHSTVCYPATLDTGPDHARGFSATCGPNYSHSTICVQVSRLLNGVEAMWHHNNPVCCKWYGQPVTTSN